MSKLISIIKYLSRKNCTREDMLKIQSKMFRKQLQKAYHDSPFYREYYSSHGIKEKDLEDVGIRDLPFTNREIILDNYDNIFTNRDLKKAEIQLWFEKHDPKELFKNKYFINSSSGSTKKVGIFVNEKSDYDYTLMLSFCRTLLYDQPFFKLFNTRTVFFFSSLGFNTAQNRLRVVGKNTISIPAQDPLENYIDILNKFQPELLISTTSSLLLVAELAKQNKLKIRPTKIMVTGETLTEGIADGIRSAWNIEPLDAYGSAETKTLGFRKSIHDEFEIWDDLNIFEVLDEKNQPVSAGNIGRAITTNLYNLTMPLIRYELGDKIITSSKPSNSCFTRIVGIPGRVLEKPLPIVTNDGKNATIAPDAISSFYIRELKRFQFVFTSPNNITVNYVTYDNVDRDELVMETFKRFLTAQNAEQGTIVKVKRVNVIKPEPTGKVPLVKVVP